MARRRKRRPNAGSFKPGQDPRRHVFTAQDCRIGYWVAAIKHPELREWLLLKIRIYYSRKEGSNAPQEDRRGATHGPEPAACGDALPW
jgi:hypothetical protein